MTIMASMQAARGGMWEASARFATSAAKVAEAGLARRSVAEVDGQAPVADAVGVAALHHALAPRRARVARDRAVVVLGLCHFDRQDVVGLEGQPHLRLRGGVRRGGVQSEAE